MSSRIFPLIDRLSSRAAEAPLRITRIANAPRRNHLRDILSRHAGERGSLIADPLLEAAFGSKTTALTISDLVAEGLLHEDTALALAETKPLNEKERDDRNAMPLDRHPYTHQEAAWRKLAEAPPRSVLVSSSTGSGKTEAFLIPILDSLVRQRTECGKLTGVQALFLYPLNALIASQRDRLADWTAPFRGDIRFCLYNGETPEDPPRGGPPNPYEVSDRFNLRGDPPPILVTNATMLEYMLVRAKDAGILEQSAGKLRWVVLDEAHSYLGSQAAEMTMLLRRTLHAFGVEPKNVSFIATSATLGDGERIREQLAEFLRQLSGAPPEQVDVIFGEKDLPPLPADGFSGLASDPVARSLRIALSTRPMRLSEIERVAGERAREILDKGALPSGPKGEAFLPLRLHLFHRAQAGVFACIDPTCSERAGTPLDHTDWPFGAVYERDRTVCSCGARTLEVVLCDSCGQPLLNGSIDRTVDLISRWREEAVLDEFTLAADAADAEDDDSDEEAPLPKKRIMMLPIGRSAPAGDHAAILNVVRETGELRGTAAPDTVRYLGFSPEFCPCCGDGSNGGRLFRSVRLGGPFYVGVAGNVLLESATPHRDAAKRSLPQDGRQIITFTDNRQGTARFAATWQQEIERSYARSRIWHRLQESRTGVATDKLLSDIQHYEGLPSHLLAGPVLEHLDALRRQRDRAGLPQPIKWHDLRDSLAARINNEPDLLALWATLEPDLCTPRDLATLYLYAEFFRRPQRANSLETLGLAALRFPAIEDLNDAFLPRLFRGCGATVEDWKDYLHVVITFFVRANSVVEIDDTILRWTGQRIRPRSFVPWNLQREPGLRERRWPILTASGRRTSRPVLLLRDAFGLNLDDAAVREEVNDTLDAAWRALNSVSLRGLADGAFKLDLNTAEVTSVDRAWLCPVTMRLLDRTFRGITPYLAIIPSPGRKIVCTEVRMPRLPYPWLRMPDDPEGPKVRDARQATERWLVENRGVAALREQGLWTDINDRLAVLSRFARIAEHSAQQPSTRLRNYEKGFKGGSINVLTCSTTMEMGVDIGGITTVAMTNVPPSPANYRQRVGRAGRRSEPLAVALTYCSDTPVGWHSFDRPDWPLTQKLTPPRVALDSRVLVQRHMNAFLLSRFLYVHDLRALQLNAGEFFAPPLGVDAPAERFTRWLRETVPVDGGTIDALRQLTGGTAMAGVNDIPERTAVAIERITQAWREERELLAQDLEGLVEGPAKRSIQMQADRMDGEYLLGELARDAFLPGHGFPTDVVPFVTPRRGLGTGGKEGSLRPGREDSLRARRFPSRPLEIALREYAPGADVVLDGIVYRSAGVTLNWKRPVSQEATETEIQALRWFWSCPACGAAGDQVRNPAACGACGHEGIVRERALRPAGFSADPSAKLTNAVEYVDFVPHPSPLVSASRGDWVALENPELGRFRRDPDGQVITLSRGTTGKGYAICLMCGRAEPEIADRSTPLPPHPRISGHRPLRASPRHRLQCDGPEQGYAVQRHLSLGHSRRTDVFEVQLTDAPGQEVATTVAVAMREALCRRLGIERDEVSLQVGQAPGPEGRPCWSIWLFDTAAGGAGYAGAAGADLTDILHEALDALECTNGCERACPACLILRDTARMADRLDRHAAADWLRNLRSRLVLPVEAHVFGTGAEQRIAQTPLPVDISRKAAEGDAELLFILRGQPPAWDIGRWWAVPVIERLSRGGARVTVGLTGPALAGLDLDTLQALRSLADRAGGGLTVTPLARTLSPDGLVAVVTTRTGTVGWAVLADGDGVPGPELPTAVVRGSLPYFPDCGPPLDLDARLRALRPNATRISISTECDGPSLTFGMRFWKMLASSPAVAAAIRQCGLPLKVEYDDRYLLAPVAVRLLWSVLKQLRLEWRAASTPPIPLTVRTLGERRGLAGRISDGFRDDWPDLQLRAKVMAHVLAEAGYKATIQLGTTAELPHGRALRLFGEQHVLDIILDQGFGFWEPTRRIPFGFHESEEAQAKRVTNTAFDVSGMRGRTTDLFVDLREMNIP